ncbi:hypothetical protein M2351_002885 [Azospirillum canadense]|nr:hypothetical protein [Azospirillum canadense]MCW2238322.1 hypothetical protein [Azospirillum canadense]
MNSRITMVVVPAQAKDSTRFWRQGPKTVSTDSPTMVITGYWEERRKAVIRSTPSTGLAARALPVGDVASSGHSQEFAKLRPTTSACPVWRARIGPSARASATVLPGGRFSPP